MVRNLDEGDFVEVTSSNGAAHIKRKQLIDPDDILTPEEAKLVRKGEQQVNKGQFVTLETLTYDLGLKHLKRGRKAA